MQRRCDITKCSDGKWYMVLGDNEYAYDDWNCTTYGGYDTEEEVWKELDNHSNPGGMDVDRTGTQPPPKNAVKATKGRWFGGLR
jgi:hypothetical protein